MKWPGEPEPEDRFVSMGEGVVELVLKLNDWKAHGLSRSEILEIFAQGDEEVWEGVPMDDVPPQAARSEMLRLIRTLIDRIWEEEAGNG